ncbi:sugar transferase [Sulfurimonas sp. NW15]|uniref:sugar transferase n=1 Tax=Sulfurimonas sp. NW15 TaxID=2922729 RepID=UPI003DA92425
MQNRLLLKHNIMIKNSVDYILLCSVLPVFFAIHIIIAFAIKLDDGGTVFFRQKRLGKDNKTFQVYKYRTMLLSSEKVLEKYLKSHPEEVRYFEKYHKYMNDPRITRIGKFLRIFSLDELPQILNILKGEMSWVGPRPYMLNEAEKLGNKKEFILRVRPGITGLWQVSGRNNLSFAQRNELEVWYIKNWSLWADFVILIKTVKVVLGKIGAK